MDLINKSGKAKKSFDGAKLNTPKPRIHSDFRGEMSRPVGRPSIPLRRAAPVNSARGVNGLNVQRRVPERKLAQDKVFEKKENSKPEESKESVAVLDRLVMACIFMLFAGLPLFFLGLTYQGINFEKQYYFYLWTFIGIVAWGAKSIIVGSLTIRRTPLDFSLLAVLVVYGLSTLFSIDRYHSFFGFFSNPVQGFVSVLIMILAYYLIIMNINYSRAKILLTTVITVGSLISIWVFLGVIGIMPINVFDKIPLNFIGVSFSSLATYLGMLLPLLLTTLSLTAKSKKNIPIKPMINVGLFFVLIITIFNISTLFNYVRWIPLLISMSVLLVFIMGRVINFSQKMVYVSVGTFLLLVTLFITGSPIFKSNILPAEASIDYDLTWRIAEGSIKTKPILGSGPSTYGYNFSLFLNRPMDVRFYSGRGLLLESLTTIGILGFIGFIAVVLTYIGSVVHMLNKYGNKNKVMSLGIFVAVITMIFTAGTWNLDGGLLLFGVLLAALSIRVVQGESNSEGVAKTFSLKTSPQHALMHSFLFLVIVMGVIFGFVTFGKMFFDDYNAGKAVKAQEQGDFAKGLKYLMRTNDLSHREGRYYTIGAQYSLLLANKSITEEDKQTIQHINNAVDQAVLGAEMMPNDVFANEVAGFVYESGWKYISSSNALDEARKFYKKASELEPENPSFYMSLGKIDLIEMQSIKTADEINIKSKKELAENAQKLFETAEDKFTLKNKYAPVYYYLATTNEFLGDIDEAIRNMDEAVEVSKEGLNTSDQLVYDQMMAQQINYGFNLARLLQIRGAVKGNVNAQADNERAESLFKQIIGVNDDEMSALLSLGALYESTRRWDEAIEQYNKVLEVLPEDSQARESVKELIEKLNSKKASSSSETGNDKSSSDDEYKEVENGGPGVSASSGE